MFLAGQKELNGTRTFLIASWWTIISLLMIFLPFQLNIQDHFLQTVCSVLGAFLLSSAAIGTLNSYFLRESQLNATRQLLGESLVTFKEEVEANFLKSFDWVSNVTESGLRKVYDEIPSKEIKRSIRKSRGDSVRFLFLSYATIDDYKEEFGEAVSNGCTIDIIIADPKLNCLINYSENDLGEKAKRERSYAEIGIDTVSQIKRELEENDKLEVHLYRCPNSLVVVETGDRMWFGVLWAHRQSFMGPWFEIHDLQSNLASWARSHVDKIMEDSEILKICPGQQKNGVNIQ